jgi:two-component system chemotaxis response regulator CheY
VRVLVAEDSALTRAMLRNALTTMGHECLVAADGDEAWKLFQQSGADVIISDRLMPGLDGLELCRRVREYPGVPYTYFVFLTALAHKSEILEGMHEGADDYLTKPLDLDELRARLIAADRVTSLHRRLGEQASALERSNRALYDIARTDPLTGLGNRLQMTETLTELQARADRYGHSYALALCDLDRFKAYNDVLGHLEGDHALRTVATILKDTIRGGDSLYRYGGEELLVVLPEQTLDSAELAGERIRRAVSAAGLPHPNNPPHGIVTLSIGIAALDSTGVRGFGDVIAEADAALYEAKRAGRNRVAVARTPATA